MLKRIVFVLLLLHGVVFAQVRVITNDKGELITEFEYDHRQPLRYKGSIFWKDTTQLGVFCIKGGDTLRKPVLLDLLNHSFLAEFGERFVPISNTAITLGSHHFVHIKGYLYEYVSEGIVKVLARTSCKLAEYQDPITKTAVVRDNYRGDVVRSVEYFLEFPNHKIRGISFTTRSVSLALVGQYGAGLFPPIDETKIHITDLQGVLKLLNELEKGGFLY
ncbi:MAG: hypothetical protein U0Y10_11990 [Spirosomataceae bacterium]